MIDDPPPISVAATAPVGVYDSGVGGVSVLRALRAALPNESFVYVADSGHAPYGERDRDFLESRARDVMRFFVRRRAKAVVLACNTVSVAAATALRRDAPMPVVAMEPAIKPAAQATRSGTVLVLATAYTVASEAVARLLALHGEGRRILLQPCPGLVEQVERVQFDAPRTLALLDVYVGPGVRAGADTIVLGCTHYAFLADQIARIAGPGVTLVEPSPAVARQVARQLEGRHAPLRVTPRPSAFHTSGDVGRLREFLAAVGEPASCVLPLHDAA